MNDSDDTPLHLAHCRACGTWTWPATAWGCRRCGAGVEQLDARTPPHAPVLRNAVTVHAELAPGLPVPCVIGEVELAPGVIEEALIDVADESLLQLGMPLRARSQRDAQDRLHWRFSPTGNAGAAA